MDYIPSTTVIELNVTNIIMAMVVPIFADHAMINSATTPARSPVEIRCAYPVGAVNTAVKVNKQTNKLTS